MTTPLKVEVVRAEKPFFLTIFSVLFLLAIRTFFVWWAVAVWFPQLGLTYWQLVLPVYALPMLFNSGSSELFKRTFKPASWSLPKA